MIRRLRYATALAKRLGELIDNTDHCGYHLVNAAEEKRTTFLREHRRVLWGEPKSLGCGIVLDIAGAGHATQPLPRVAFLNAHPASQLCIRTGSVGGQVFE